MRPKKRNTRKWNTLATAQNSAASRTSSRASGNSPSQTVKVQLMVREGNEAVLGFYDGIGYERFAVSTTGKRLIADA